VLRGRIRISKENICEKKKHLREDPTFETPLDVEDLYSILYNAK
jgi:hypothetical protein